VSQVQPQWRHPIELSNDYAAETPIWVDGGLLVDLDRLGISGHLQDSLIAWQRHFEEHFRPLLAWDSPQSRAAYAEAGPVLLDRLRRALPHVEVTLDMWPLNEDD
jgi:hypothetical protein